jgi:orotate phosphoribosyltransferase-like protein
MSELYYDIIEMYEEGMSIAEIASRLNMDVSAVDDVLAGHYADHPEIYDGQPDEAQEWHDFDPDC